MTYLPLLLAWLLYYVLHSVLAAQSVKDRCARLWPGIMPWYRLLFNLISIAGLGLILLIPTGPAHLLWASPFWQKGLGYGLMALGGLAVLIVFRGYDSREFFGWPPQKEAAEMALLTGGWHRYVRHPLYTGGIIVLIGYLLAAPTIAHAITVGCGLLYLYVGTLFEERKLVRQFGEAYRQYQQQTPMLIPKLGISGP